MRQDRFAYPHAVYRIYDDADRLLYIGVSYDPDDRLKGHKYAATWVDEYHHHDATWYDTRDEAEAAEAAAIKAEHPVYNVMHNATRDRTLRSMKIIRITPELGEANVQFLKRFARESGAEVRASHVLRALLDELQADPDLAAQVQARIWASND